MKSNHWRLLNKEKRGNCLTLTANGGGTTYTRNALSEVTDLVNTNASGSAISQFSGITHDALGNRTFESTTMSSNTAYSGTTSYTYNGLDELTDEDSTASSGYNNTFAYDGAENQTTFRSVSGKTYNTDNQLSSTGFTFDGDGNPTTYSGTSFSFDAENRLTSIGSAFTAAYDAMDLRAWKANSSGTTYFLYDSMRQPICELNSGGTVTATNSFGANGLVSRNTSAGSVFYEFDVHGSVTNRLNPSGANITTSTTDAFGDVASTATASDPFGYGAEFGYYTDNETGLVLTTYRYYDPSVGRYLNRDPVGYNGGVNIYNYTANNPTNRVDPTGHSWKGDLYACVLDAINALIQCILNALGVVAAILLSLVIVCVLSAVLYPECVLASLAIAQSFLDLLVGICLVEAGLNLIVCGLKGLAAYCDWFPDEKPAIHPKL